MGLALRHKVGFYKQMSMLAHTLLLNAGRDAAATFA